MFKPTRTSGDQTQNDPNKKKRGIVSGVILLFLLIGFINFLSGGSSTKTSQNTNAVTKQPEAVKIEQPEATQQPIEQVEITHPAVAVDPTEKLPKYEIAYRDNSLKTLRLYISIDPISKNPAYEKNIKNIIKYVSEKESSNIAMTFVDDKQFLKEYYENDAGESTSGVSMEKAIAFQKDKRNIEKKSLHIVAMYSGDVQFTPYQLSFFPSAFTDNPSVGKLVKNESFNPKDYSYNF